MTKEQVNALRNAGISESAIIDRILAEDTNNTPEAVPEAENGANNEPEAAKPAIVPDDKADAILAAIDRLTGAIRTSNLRTGRDTPNEASVDDILASIVTPVKK